MEVEPLALKILELSNFSEGSEVYKKKLEALKKKSKEDLVDILSFQGRDVKIYSQQLIQGSLEVEGLPLTSETAKFNRNVNVSMKTEDLKKVA